MDAADSGMTLHRAGQTRAPALPGFGGSDELPDPRAFGEVMTNVVAIAARHGVKAG